LSVIRLWTVLRYHAASVIRWSPRIAINNNVECQLYMAMDISNSHQQWAEAAKGIDWFTPPSAVLDGSNPPFSRWYPAATCNTCFNSLDRHVNAGRGDQVALIYESPVTGQRAEYTYRELLERVSRFAGALRDLGVEANRAQERGCRGPGRALRFPLHPGHRRDVVENVEVRHEAGVLHHVADASAERDRILVSDIDSVEQHRSRCRLDHAVDHAQQRGLATPR